MFSILKSLLKILFKCRQTELQYFLQALYSDFVLIPVPNTEITCPYDNPNGLLLINDLITPEEEEAFIKLFDFKEDKESNLKNRQVKHYGYEFRYGSNDVDLSSPLHEKIPEECDLLWRRLRKHGLEVVPDQLTVNKYAPGQGKKINLLSL